MYCVECGKNEVFKDGVCKNCYIKTHTFTRGPKIIDIPVCSYCNSYKYKNTWTAETFTEVLKRIIKQNFDINRILKNINIQTECKDEKHGIKCKVLITGFIDDMEITEKHDVFIRLKKTICNTCSKQYGGYYESIIQIRTEGNRKLTKKELKDIEVFVLDTVEDMYMKGNRALFISDYGMEHGGLDFYLSEKNAAYTIAKMLQENYGGTIKQSSKNIGMKDSKQIYRMTYLIRLPLYKKNDIIRIKNMFFLVKTTTGNKIKIINLEDWSETTVEAKKIQNISLIGGVEQINEMIIISQTDDEIQLMNQKNYKIRTVKKPRKIFFKDEKIKTIEIDDQIYIIPQEKGIG